MLNKLWRHTFFVCAALYCFIAHSQTLKIDGVTAMTCDKQGNLFVVRSNSVTKYSSKLQSLARYTSTLGNIYSLDVLDPFKILLFSQQFVRLNLLDNQLSPLGNAVFLPDINVQQPLVVCRSAEHAVWLIDGYKEQLLQYDLVRASTREIASLTHYTQNGKHLPTYAIERNGKLYVNFADNSIAVFDKFGALLHLYSIVLPNWFEVQGSTLYYLADKCLYAQNLLNQALEPTRLAVNVTACALAQNEFWLYQEGEIKKIEIP
ncbi:MAG: hypothetical protein ACRCZB_02405 [Bacteroidales bacterium]